MCRGTQKRVCTMRSRRELSFYFASNLPPFVYPRQTTFTCGNGGRTPGVSLEHCTPARQPAAAKSDRGLSNSLLSGFLNPTEAIAHLLSPLEPWQVGFVPPAKHLPATTALFYSFAVVHARGHSLCTVQYIRVNIKQSRMKRHMKNAR